MFDSVVVACDQWSLDIATAIRASLELFRLRVHLYFCVQKQNVLDVLAGNIPASEYVVLCTHGIDTEGVDIASPDTYQAGFKVVDRIDGEWRTIWFALTPSVIPDLVKLPGRTVLSTGCASGREPLAREFVSSGCRAYLGPVEDVDQDACALFAIGFFYHLLSIDRDSEIRCTDQEAAERAAQFDRHARSGTHLFRYYTASSCPSSSA